TERHGVGHRVDHPGRLGGRESVTGERATRRDGAAHGHAEGREWRTAVGPGRDLVEQQYGGGDRERERAGEGRDGGLGDDHGHERRTERYIQRHGGAGAGRGGDGDPVARERAG